MALDFFSLPKEKKESIARTFEKNVRRSKDPHGCWIYEKDFRTTGYTNIGFIWQGKIYKIQTHRYSWMVAYNTPIPPGLMCCHSCDNRECVFPGHIFLATAKINAQDAALKGRMGRNGIKGKDGRNNRKIHHKTNKV